MIRTPDQRLRVFVSSTLAELADERVAVRRAVEGLRLSPVMFEAGARPHPPRELYRAYLDQSHVFIGVYWERYGWIAPGESISGLEDEYRLAQGLPQLIYIKEPAPKREDALQEMLREVKAGDQTSYRRFGTIEELEELVSEDLAVLLSERFESARAVLPQGRAAVPQLLTPTIGRDADVARVLELLASGARLVTVTGPGGVGKTRVALAVAHAREQAEEGPAYHVALASVSEPGLVMPTVADALGVREMTGRSPLQTVVEFLGTSHALLVLDNLEQVIDVAPEIVSLVERAPNVQVLATSRPPLRVRGEREVPLGPLATPPPEATTRDIGQSPAVQLFLDRAHDGIGLTDDNARAVAELCRRLDGIPLAIELAVARLRLMTPEQLLDRLGTLLDLETGPTGLPARQQTLRATLDWSHQLLTEQEQSLFARQAVFAGGATLDALESVCDHTDGAVLDTLPGLLDQGLVVADGGGVGGEPRFRMLEPVAEYARQRLADREDAADSRRRHAGYYLRLGREAQPSLCGPRQREWAARYDDELPNLRAAIATCLEDGEEAQALRMVWDTVVYFYIRDSMEEPHRWVKELERRRDRLDATGEALLDIGLVMAGESPPDRDVIRLLEDASAVLERARLPLEAAVARQHQGIRWWQAGDAVAAIDTFEQAARQFDALDHDWGVAWVEMASGAVCAALSRQDQAIAHFRRSLVRSTSIDNRPQMAQAQQGLALVCALEGRVDEGRAALVEAIDIVAAERSLTLATYCAEALAAVALADGAVTRAAAFMGAARETRRRVMIPQWTALADAAEPVITEARGLLSAQQFEAAWQQGATWDVRAALQDELAQPSTPR